MDINDYVFGSGVVTPEQQKMLAASLRGRDNMGAIMALSGDKAVAPVGQQYMDTANKGIQQGLTHNYYQGMLRSSEADRQLRKTLAEAENKLGYARIGAMDRQTAARGSKINKLPPKVADKLVASGSMMSSIDSLSQGWKDEWHSSIPGMNMFKNWAGRVAPDMATDNMKEFYGWRRQFASELESAIRHELYGTALTKSEISRWLGQTLDPAATPEQVKQYFTEFRTKVGREMESRVAGASYEYGPEIVNAYLSGFNPEGVAPAQQQQMPEEDDPLGYEVLPRDE